LRIVLYHLVADVIVSVVFVAHDFASVR